jgi:hypothetical protein
MFGRLYIEERGRSERAVELLSAVTIGSTADNDIILDSDGVSHCHAMLLAQPGGVTLLDLGSTFGTFVDTVQALPDEPMRLPDGARISIGRAVLRYAAPQHDSRQNGAAPRPGAPPRLTATALNTRLDGIDPDGALPVDRRVSLLVWVGAPLLADQCQSSRPLALSLADLPAPTAFNVRVRSASSAWSVVAEQPTLLAAPWGTAQIARYQIVARRPNRSKLAINLERAESRELIQRVLIGVVAVAAGGLPAAASPPSLAGSSAPQALCRRCGGALRAAAKFCPNCGSARS